MTEQKNQPLIMIVGVCAAGKSTLSLGLRQLGYNAKSFAQEHSVSPRLWQRRNPDFLIVLDCQFDTVKQRKKITWGEKKYLSQKQLLTDAKDHADLIVITDQFKPHELIGYVHAELLRRGIFPNKEDACHGDNSSKPY